MSRQNWPCTLAAWSAGVAGFLMVIGGTGHLVAILAVASADQRPFDFKLVSLIAIGGFMLYPGLLNAGVAWWIGRGQHWAFAMSAFGTVALLSFMALLLFMKSPPDSQNPLGESGAMPLASVLLNIAHLAVLSAMWIVVLKRRATASQRIRDDHHH